jgi:hypothetical protein
MQYAMIFKKLRGMLMNTAFFPQPPSSIFQFSTDALRRQLILLLESSLPTKNLNSSEKLQGSAKVAVSICRILRRIIDNPIVKTIIT